MDTAEATPTECEAPPTSKAAKIEGGDSSAHVEGGSERMEITEPTKSPGREGGKKAEGKKEAEKKVEPEPEFEMLSNPARVLPAQVPGVSGRGLGLCVCVCVCVCVCACTCVRACVRVRVCECE